ncbi:hypothetical protein GCM10009689_17400 [Brevibacterium antiquum]|uniref:hypothetical protein n=2 Tax=Brevibacterium antiquum TaxID=234835 RepID=UPI001E44BCAF|nr:hypothetical protein [Brevibacterium antiquum]
MGTIAMTAQTHFAWISTTAVSSSPTPIALRIEVTKGSDFAPVAATTVFIKPDRTVPVSEVIANLNDDEAAALRPSGLLDTYFSDRAPLPAEADATLASFIDDLGDIGHLYLAASNVSSLRSELGTNFPELFSRLHYRSIDVDSVEAFTSIFFNRARPRLVEGPRLVDPETAIATTRRAVTNCRTMWQFPTNPSYTDENAIVLFTDVETTGLSHLDEALLEVGMIATRGPAMEEIGRFQTLLRPQGLEPETIVADFSDFIADMHSTSGLTADYLAGPVPTTVEADKDVAEFITSLPAKPDYFGGASMTLDRNFLSANLDSYQLIPAVNLDATSVTTMVSTLLDPPDVAMGTVHRAIDDVEYNIRQFTSMARALNSQASAIIDSGKE